MDEAHRQITQQHVADPKRIAELGLKHIARQKQIIGSFRADGPARASAEGLLTTMLESQVLHEEHRDRLRRELGLA
jgi:hypothetical protein